MIIFFSKLYILYTWLGIWFSRTSIKATLPVHGPRQKHFSAEVDWWALLAAAPEFNCTIFQLQWLQCSQRSSESSFQTWLVNEAVTKGCGSKWLAIQLSTCEAIASSLGIWSLIVSSLKMRDVASPWNVEAWTPNFNRQVSSNINEYTMDWWTQICESSCQSCHADPSDCPHLFDSRFSTKSSDPSASAFGHLGHFLGPLGQLGPRVAPKRRSRWRNATRREPTARSFSPPRSNAKGLAEEQRLLGTRLLRSQGWSIVAIRKRVRLKMGYPHAMVPQVSILWPFDHHSMPMLIGNTWKHDDKLINHSMLHPIEFCVSKAAKRAAPHLLPVPNDWLQVQNVHIP